MSDGYGCCKVCGFREYFEHGKERRACPHCKLKDNREVIIIKGQKRPEGG